MSSLYDEDGIDGPFNRAMAKPARSTGERIALTTDTAGRTVSTIYLGVLARASYGSAALVYETMALPCGTWSERYETEAEALKGHARMVEQYLGEVAS